MSGFFLVPFDVKDEIANIVLAPVDVYRASLSMFYYNYYSLDVGYSIIMILLSFS